MAIIRSDRHCTAAIECVEERETNNMNANANAHAAAAAAE